MQLIRCTQKLQKEIGLKKSDLAKSEPEFSFLGSWHANLLHIDRKKCVLFVNDKTLFNFIVPDVNRTLIKELSKVFVKHLFCVLASEGLSEKFIEAIKTEYRNLAYAGTNSKSVLGSMNDLAFHYKHHILSEGGIHSAMVPEIIRKLNHMPMGALDYKYPIDAIQSLYAETT
jgi:hypothetical protein